MSDETTNERLRFGEAQSLPPGFADSLAGQPAGYSAETAYMLAIVSGWAYADKSTLERQFRYHGLDRATVDQVQIENDAMLLLGTAYLIRSASGKTGILAFRGTMPTSIITWLADFDSTWRKFYDSGRVHAGFFSNVEALWGDIARWLVEATTASNPPDTRKPLEALYITGHSLGAAMAVLAAARLLRDKENTGLLRGVYTYGQPMIGDRAFMEACNPQFGAILFRHVYNADIVCHMPSRSIGPYVHFGNEFFSTTRTETWDRATKSRSRPASYFVPALLSAALSYYTRRVGMLQEIKLPYSLDDHLPTNYINMCRTSLAASRRKAAAGKRSSVSAPSAVNAKSGGLSHA